MSQSRQDVSAFSVKDRDLVRDRVLQLAASDPRVVAGAVVGSLAHDEGDRWSDLDLTFAVADNVPILDVLGAWTRNMVDEFAAAHLFDLPSGTSIYRVFLLPACLQFDLSFTPASDFGATGPKFKLLFGHAVEKAYLQSPSAQDLFGYAVHHAVRARFCIERGRYCARRFSWRAGDFTRTEGTASRPRQRYRWAIVRSRRGSRAGGEGLTAAPSADGCMGVLAAEQAAYGACTRQR